MDIDLDALEARARDTSNWMVPFDSDRGAYFNIGMGEMFALIRFARDLDAAGETLSAGVDEFATILEERNRERAALTAQLADRDAQIATLREALKEVEWLPGPHYTHDRVKECPCCTQAEYQGHAGDCLIGRALAAAAPPAE